MTKTELDQLLNISIEASIKAGDAILTIYNSEFDVEIKDDKSPLTKADTNSNDVINSYISKTNIPILSEEGRSISFVERKDWGLFWIVDPLDGTKEFIKRNGEFTVNIALIENNVPILGVIYIPVHRTLYFADENNGSFKVLNINSNQILNFEEYISLGVPLPILKKDSVFSVVGSKSHMTPETEAYINQIKKKHKAINIFSKGSSLKICMVAEGKANEYPRFAPTMEWDVAAGHAIVKFAGGSFLNYETGKEMTYNTKTLLNPWFLVKTKEN